MNGCWVWVRARNETGYGVLRRNGKNLKAHRAAWEAVNGPIPKGMCVLHRCDNPPCVNPEHLFLGTMKDNTADMIEKGRCRAGGPRGEDCGTARLTLKQVREIRGAIGETQRSIANRFGVSREAVSAILTKRNWGWV